MIPNYMTAIVAKLEADADVAALASSRVYAMELPRAEAPSMPRKALVLRYAGRGPGGIGSKDFVEIVQFRIDAFSYGETPFEADKLNRAVHSAMQFMRRTKQGDTLLHGAELDGGPNFIRDQDTDWPIVFESWIVMASEYLIA